MGWNSSHVLNLTPDVHARNQQNRSVCQGSRLPRSTVLGRHGVYLLNVKGHRACIVHTCEIDLVRAAAVVQHSTVEYRRVQYR